MPRCMHHPIYWWRIHVSRHKPVAGFRWDSAYVWITSKETYIILFPNRLAFLSCTLSPAFLTLRAHDVKSCRGCAFCMSSGVTSHWWWYPCSPGIRGGACAISSLTNWWRLILFYTSWTEQLLRSLITSPCVIIADATSWQTLSGLSSPSSSPGVHIRYLSHFFSNINFIARITLMLRKREGRKIRRIGPPTSAWYKRTV